MAEALRVVGERLVHLHVVENDRGIPGSGHIPWDVGYVEALDALSYDGWATLEMFVLPRRRGEPRPHRLACHRTRPERGGAAGTRVSSGSASRDG